MFKKLKDKIAEEVKISPQRMQQIQQFTQSMTDKLQQGLEQGTVSPDDGLFSISEDDSKADSGFTNVPLVVSTSAPELPHRPRRNSNSSIASDVSFLPRYESSMNSYHLQSDLDVSASEVEDNLSQQSSTLGHVSKEQVHMAFQKAQMRYHKYRGRYTDLANHYKELERENAKMKAVLVETQDKAIRRVSELKEQCTLSQRAKADLEAALRVEIEEKQIVIGTLKQKVDLLQSGAELNGSDGLSTPSTPSTTTSASASTPITNGNASGSSHVGHAANEELIADLNEKLQEYKANTIVSREKLSALQRELDEARKTLQEAAEREKGNNLKFAKSKMDLHTELQNRELEITNMKQDLEAMRVDLEAYEKGGGLKAQNANLIEKCEALKARNHELEAELLKTAQYKLEIQDLRETLREVDALKTSLRENQEKLDELRSKEAEITNLRSRLAEIDGLKSQLEERDLQLQGKDKEMYELRFNLDEMLANQETLENLRQKHSDELRTLQEETKQSLVALQDKIQTALTTEYSEKERKLKEDFEVKLQQLNQDGDSLKQTQIKLMQAEDELQKVGVSHRESSEALSALKERNVQLEKNYVVLMEENNGRQREIADLEAQVKRLQGKIESEQRELKNLQEDKSRLEADGRKALADRNKSEEELNEEVRRLRGEVQEKIDALKVLEDGKHDRELVSEKNEKLQREVEEVTRRERMMSDDMVALKENRDLLEEKLTEVNTNVDLLKTKIGGLIETENGLKERLKEAHDELEVKTSLANEQGAELARLKEELVVRTHELEAVTEEKRGLSRDKANLEENLRDLDEKLTEFNENVLKLQEKCSQLERDSEELRRQEIHWKETAKRLEDDVESKNAVRANDNGTILLLKQDIVTKDEEISRLRATLETTTRDSEVIRTQMSELTKKIDELEQLQVKFVELQHNYTKLRENHEELRTKHDKSEGISELLRAQLNEATDAKQVAEARWRTEKEGLIAQLEELTAKFEKLRLETQENHANNENYVENNVYEEKCKELDRMKVNYDEVDKRVTELQETVTLLQDKEESLMQSQLVDKQILVDQLNDVSGKYQEVFVKFEALTNENRELVRVQDVNKRLEMAREELQVTVEELRENEEKLKRDVSRTEDLLREQVTIAKELAKFKDMYTDVSGALETRTNEADGFKCEVESLTSRNNELSADNKRLMDENDKLLAESSDIMLQLATKITNTDAEVAAKLHDANAKYTDALDAAARAEDELDRLKRQTSTLGSSRAQHEKQIADLERHVSELEQERQFLKDEIDELKTTPINITTASVSEKDVECLQAKLAQYKSIDQTNRSSIEFYEHELQKLQSKNEKLNRKLDETLVTLNHCADLSASTEVEYLKNVLYNYMLGKESVVLARVIAAVCKFDRQQTETVLKHEQHKQSLLGQLGIL